MKEFFHYTKELGAGFPRPVRADFGDPQLYYSLRLQSFGGLNFPSPQGEALR
ncbi:hypothetical protein [Massilia sp. TN1-12]|uniref:hypothetical protein n=1 Tax=Massilia paldalensis TaxID=3377675 RepID=UPI00384AFCB7